MASSPPPRRRFMPDPVETSVRSSRRAQQDSGSPPSTSPSRPAQKTDDNMAATTKPRKFLPQPVEESSRSSRKREVEHIESAGVPDQAATSNPHYQHADDPALPSVPNSRPATTAPRRFAVEPVETTQHSSRKKFAPEPVESSSRSSRDKKSEEEETKPRRKFAPQPVESSTRSSKDKKPEDENSKPKRRFAPQPIESSARSSKDKKEADQDSKPRRKFAPEPVETSSERRRRKPAQEEDHGAEDGPGEPDSESPSATPSRSSSGGRKFEPELLETARGSYRREPVNSPTKPKEVQLPAPPSELEAEDEVTGLEESRFSAAALAKRRHEEHRRHSFMVPDLPIIESDSDNESEAPSLTDSPSSIDTDQPQPHPPTRRAGGDSYTDYVLRLAAQSVTEKELQDQAMAAYINERVHEPVAHFAIDHDDDDDTIRVGKLSGAEGVDVKTFRRSSQDDLDWEMANMRKHHRQLEEAKRQFKADTAGQSRFSAAALATRHHMEAAKEKKVKKARGGLDEDSELARMRAAASPPMLGENLVFPFTISPKMTRCDTDQPPRPRNADSDDEPEPEGDPSLWNAKVNVANDAGDGLWMGLCHRSNADSSRPSTPIRSGIQTPAVERTNPFDTSTPRGHQTPGRRGGRPFSGLTFLPLTPPRSAEGLGEDAFTNTIDKKLQLEKQIEEQFPNSVVTQIYNYLSLGYPSLAHGFDDELSKISRIPIEELRKDDDHVDIKGHVGAPEGDGCDESEVVGGKCKRWEALRLYVREWARQSPNFADERRKVLAGGKGNEAWGATVRKGSWAQ